MADRGDEERRPLAVELPPPLAAPEPGSARDPGDPGLGLCLVTGGAGFLGRHLTLELVCRGHRVRVFDARPFGERRDGIDFVRGDVRSPEDVRKACEGVDTVFHTAARLDFSDFPTPAQREESWGVNVSGVENVVRAAREAGAKRLVHTSSNNVTLDEPVIDGDETLPYAARPRDVYTETKIAGEKAALAANGRGGLLVCAIRPGGIYGPGDPMLLPRVVAECAAGRYLATIGNGSALSDNTFVENLVDGMIQAARHLVPGSPVPGQAYYVTDGNPVNYFEFFRPLIEGLGYRHPKVWIPGSLAHSVMRVWERLHRAIGLPRPLLTPLEVRKIVVSHYNRIDKARRDFGWTPPVSVEEATARSLAYCRELVARERS